MSATAQAKAARRKALQDERYNSRGRKDAGKMREKEARKVAREIARRARKKK